MRVPHIFCITVLSVVAFVSASEENLSFIARIGRFFSRNDNKKDAQSTEGVKMDGVAVKNHLTEAENFMGLYNYSKAVDKLLTVLENSSAENQKANALLGTCFLAIDRPDLAESFLYTAVRVSNYTDIASISNLAESLRLNGDANLAIEVLERSIQKQEGPSTGMLEFVMGESYASKEDYKTAADWFLASALLKPDHEEAWLRASTLQFPPAHQSYDMAESVLTRAMKAIPSSSEFAFSIASVLHATSRVEQAVVFYDEALRLQPTHAGAASNLATALHGMGRLSDAAPLYAQAVQLSPNNAVLLSNYAIFLNTLKRFQSAYNILMRAVSVEPVSADTIATKDALLPILEREISSINSCKETAIQLVQQGEWDQIVKTLLACGEPAEDAAWWFAIAGMAQHMRGQSQNAVELCMKAGSMLPSSSHVIYGCLGVASQYSNNNSEAVRYFRASRELLRMESYQDPLPFIGMSMALVDVEYNLLQALHVNGEYDACTDTALDIMRLPKPAMGGGTVLVFSFVDWSAGMVAKVDAYGKEESSAGRLLLPKKTKLHDEIKRVQSSFSLLLTPALTCMSMAITDTTSASRKNAIAALLTMARAEEKPLSSLASSEVNEKLALITQFFIPTGDQADKVRKAVQEALSRNLMNDAISDIYLINELEYDFSSLQNYEKITQFVSGTRLSFADAFRFANERLAGRRVVVANADIYFDESLRQVQHSSKINSSTVLALSKWISEGSSITLPIRADSQDAWVFQTPVNVNVIAQSNFFFGLPKCDNRLAKVFGDSGYRVINPAFAVHAIEKDERARAVLYPATGSVTGPVAQVLLADGMSI